MEKTSLRRLASALWGWKALLCVGLGCLWCLAVWAAAGALAEQRTRQLIERERGRVNAEAEVVLANIVQRLGQVRGVPIVLAGDDAVRALLEAYSPQGWPPGTTARAKAAAWAGRPDLAGMSRRLETLRKELHLETLFLLNAAGECIAAGSAPGHPSFIGENYASRQYFQAAVAGQNGRQFAVSRMGSQPSIFYASPVRSAEGRFLGAVVARTDMEYLTNLELAPDTFVVDMHGVVIKAGEGAFLLKALPGADVPALPEETLRGMYKQTRFDPLPILRAPGFGREDVVTLGDDVCPHLLASSGSPDGFLAVHVLKRLQGVEDIREERVRLGVLVSLTGMLALSLAAGSVGYVRSTRRHHRELMQLNEILARQARTDALTGCANRRTVLEALKAERRRGVRYGTALSLLSLDIDHFKHVNDQHGHLGGDHALRHFVGVVERCLRATDLLGRMGGEEFSVLLPHTGRAEAERIAERIRAAVESTPARYEGRTVGLTVSIGVAQWSLEERGTGDDLFRRCDETLYRAKAEGRNRVRVADPQGA